MNLLFTSEILESLKEIEHDGGYKNNNFVFMPQKRLIQPFENFDDLKRHIKTILLSLVQMVHIILPCSCLALGAVLKSLSSILQLNFQQAKEDCLKALTHVWLIVVASSLLSINIVLHLLSLITRTLVTVLDSIGRLCFAPSANTELNR